jgi:hypothetical protein
MTTQRAQQVDDPSALPGPEVRRNGPPNAVLAHPAAQEETMRQIAGAVSALAGRVDRQDERLAAGLKPKVTRAERREALTTAREFVSDLMLPSQGMERVYAELALARYLTGE